MNNTNDVTLLQFKLHSFNDEGKRDSFINHLDNVATNDNNITFVVAGDAVLIECTMPELAYVYYKSFADWINNENPLVVVPDDCQYSSDLSQWDCEQLEMKRWVKM